MLNRRQLLLSGLSAAATAALAGCSDSGVGPDAAGMAVAAVGTPRAQLDALLERMFQAQLQASPENVSLFGLDHGPDAAVKHRLDDRSIAARERFAREQRGFLRELDAIDRQRLDARGAVHLDAARYLCALSVQGTRQFGYGLPNASRPYAVSQRNGAYYDVPALLDTVHVVETRDDAEAYLSRLAALPAAIDQDSERARADAARGVMPPDFILDKTLSQLKALRDAPPAGKGLVVSLVRRTGEQGLGGDWSARAARIVQGRLRQALDRQVALLERWRPRASSMPGVARLPEGEAYYRWALRLNTTAQVSAAELHRQALEQAAEYGSRIDGLLRAQGLRDGGIGERYVAITKDPRYRYADTDAGKAQRFDDLQARLRDMQARLPQYFGTTPKAVPVLRRQPPALEYFHPGAVAGSRPNLMLLSAYGLPDMPKWELMNTFYHEGSPGHHLQASLALESPWIPQLTKIADLRAYTEGWSLYCEQLVHEMGVNGDDPLAPLGHLRSFLVRAMQVVVDTGLHALGWSRDRAIAYVRDTSGDPPLAAADRVDRYCALPAQTIAYKFGHTHWLAMRARARQRLGAKFDLRAFHDVALRHGALPFDILDSVIDEWAAAARQA